MSERAKATLVNTADDFGRGNADALQFVDDLQDFVDARIREAMKPAPEADKGWAPIPRPHGVILTGEQAGQLLGVPVEPEATAAKPSEDAPRHKPECTIWSGWAPCNCGITPASKTSEPSKPTAIGPEPPSFDERYPINVQLVAPDLENPMGAYWSLRFTNRPSTDLGNDEYPSVAYVRADLVASLKAGTK